MSDILEIPDDITVSYGGKIKEPCMEQKSLRSVIQMIQFGSNEQKARINTLRTIADEQKRRDYKKQHLPYFSMATFTDDYRDNEHFEETQHLLYDLDHVGDWDAVQKIKTILSADPHVFFCMVSPSGDGVKFCCRMDARVTDPEEYRRIFNYYADHFEKEYGWQEVYDRRDDPSRACFLTVDGDIYVNVHSEPLTTAIPADYVIPEKYRLRALGIEHPSDDPLADLLGKSFGPGNRTPAMASIIGYFISKGIGRSSAKAILKHWNGFNSPPHAESHLEKTVIDMYDRYEHAVKRLPFDMIVKDNCYYKRIEKDGQRKDVMLTNFTVKPEELLVMEDGDCLQATVESSQGYTYKPVYLENTDWISKMRLLEAIGHQDCVMMGSDNDALALCAAVNAQVPVRKRGTRTIGLHDESVWVVEGANITVSGVSRQQTITPYQRGGESFYHNIRYKYVSDSEHAAFIREFYAHILQINKQETIVPWLSWMLTTPVKQTIMRIAEGYPIAFVHGGQGSGKTSTAKMLMRMAGYKHYEPSSCDMRRFPMLDLLCSTNGIPVVLDEFKVSDMKEDFVNNLFRFMRKVYAGETEPKGQSDLTVDQYRLTAPMCVMGEWSVNIPAISERMVMVKYTDAVKRDKGMQKAFTTIWSLPLEAFMPRYIEYVLSQDIDALYKLAEKVVVKHFRDVVIAPRVKNNLTVMVLGMKLFKSYGQFCGAQVPRIDVGRILDYELEVVTGTRTGFVRSAVDQLIEQIGVMAQNNKIVENDDFVVTHVDLKDIGSTRILGIKFNKIYDAFKEHARRTQFEGDQLDKRSYMDQFDQTVYVYGKNHHVKFPDGKAHRCVVIKIDEAKKAGLDLEGFGI
jgi:hypothetical protein